jgi:hypothetical protein
MSILGDIIFAFRMRFISRRLVSLMAQVDPRVDQLLVGKVVKQYGPFHLHELDIALEDGRIRNSKKYFVVVGNLSVPLAIAMKTDKKDPQGYRRLVKRREGPFRDCVHIGNIPIKESSHRDLYDLVDRLIKYRQVAIECYREQLPAAHDKATGNRRRARLYRKTIAELEAQQQILTEAFRAFMQEYPDAATSTKRTAASDEREARQARKRVQKGLGDINRVMA